jgi:pyruvate kinase
MKRTIIETEKIYPYYKQLDASNNKTLSIAYSATELAKNIEAKAVVAFTKSGRTARNISRFRPESPILAVTHDEKTLRRLNIVWGVLPYMCIKDEFDSEKLLCAFVNRAYKKDFDKKDRLIAVVGFVGGVTGSTSIIRLLDELDIEYMLKKEC